MKGKTRDWWPLWTPRDPNHPGAGKQWLIICTRGVENWHRLTDWPEMKLRRIIDIDKFRKDFVQSAQLPIHEYNDKVFEQRKEWYALYRSKRITGKN